MKKETQYQDKSEMTDYEKVKTLFKVYKLNPMIDGDYRMIWVSKIDGSFFVQNRNSNDDTKNKAKMHSYTRFIAMGVPPILLYLSHENVFNKNKALVLIITMLVSLILWYVSGEIDQIIELKGSNLERIKDITDVTYVKDKDVLKKSFMKGDKEAYSNTRLLAIFTIISAIGYYFLSDPSLIFGMYWIFTILTFFSLRPDFIAFLKWRKSYFSTGK